MKKIIRFALKVLGWAIITVIGSLVALAFMIGIMEGDLSHGIFYYLQ